MPPEERDPTYLWDMLDAARTVREFAAEVSPEDFLNDRKLQLAVERAIQIIGEAARHVAPQERQRHPEIPWREIIGMRHKVVHDYMGVDYDIVWDVVTVDLPQHIAALERIVPPDQADT